MISSGLVSVTFRSLPVATIISLASAARLDGIEWGGDIHVPHGDLQQARRVRQMTQDAGLAVAAYGSYYRVGVSEPCPFETVLETAIELDAPLIRVWAGKKGSGEADVAYRAMIADDSRRIAGLAAQAGKTIAYEWHGGTLTDTNESARQLLQDIGDTYIKSYWQPPQQSSLEYNLAGLAIVAQRLSNVHVYQWHYGDTIDRRPLAEGEPIWLQYLRTIATIPGDRFAMLEFVRNDDPQSFSEDASTLVRWLNEINH